tara:strand:- start:324 stop:773 length:450 start_codon:yes stop_codon:yes gene_type:complete
MKINLKNYTISFVALAMICCSPIVENRGYVFDDKLISQIQIGKTNAGQVLQILGTPSTTSTIDATTWYYIYSKAETKAFYQPSVSNRRIITLGFNENSQVDYIKEYGLEDGNVIALNTNATPTRGRELTILQQLFGNLGRLGAGNLPGN